MVYISSLISLFSTAAYFPVWKKKINENYYCLWLIINWFWNMRIYRCSRKKNVTNVLKWGIRCKISFPARCSPLFPIHLFFFFSFFFLYITSSRFKTDYSWSSWRQRLFLIWKWRKKKRRKKEKSRRISHRSDKYEACVNLDVDDVFSSLLTRIFDGGMILS